MMRYLLSYSILAATINADVSSSIRIEDKRPEQFLWLSITEVFKVPAHDEGLEG
jgi:hypothetical protein